MEFVEAAQGLDEPVDSVANPDPDLLARSNGVCVWASFHKNKNIQQFQSSAPTKFKQTSLHNEKIVSVDFRSKACRSTIPRLSRIRTNTWTVQAAGVIYRRSKGKRNHKGW
jgi:hypothetical protein